MCVVNKPERGTARAHVLLSERARFALANYTKNDFKTSGVAQVVVKLLNKLKKLKNLNKLESNE